MGRMKAVPFADFVAEIKKEIAYFYEGGTSWRKKVYYLSLLVISESNIRTTEAFTDKNAVIKLAEEIFPTIKKELSESIGFFISKIAKDLSIKANLGEDVKQYIALHGKSRRGKPLGFFKKEE